MKISAIFATALFIRSYGFVARPSTRTLQRQEDCLALSYLDELELSSPAAEATRPHINISGEDAETIALANQLGIDDNVVRNEYGRWLARYNKNFDITRYAQFKKNWLQQFSHDVKYGKFYTLNEYGDCNEDEFYQLTSQTVSAVEEEPTEGVETKANKKKRISTQPKPALALAIDACANLFKENMAKFTDFSAGFRSLNDLLGKKTTTN